ncbi:MAG: PEGA domain-containing protein [Gemmatimonadota bacterium]|nr:PEGA domain-containing protein [Gemmatimonadota bacterium]MDE2864419.1 PEGA domain-containing protein [Gemmatimonadota bacterium]
MKHLAVLVLMVVSSSGCATLFNNEVSAIGMYSSPMEADVWVDGTMRGKTPLSLELDSRKPHTVVFRKEGHSDVACYLISDIERHWLLVDLVPGLLLSVFPLVVDAVTGDWRGIDETACNVVLPQAPAAEGEVPS